MIETEKEVESLVKIFFCVGRVGRDGSSIRTQSLKELLLRSVDRQAGEAADAD